MTRRARSPIDPTAPKPAANEHHRETRSARTPAVTVPCRSAERQGPAAACRGKGRGRQRIGRTRAIDAPGRSRRSATALLLATSALVLLALCATAQTTLPGEAPSALVLAAQERADKAFAAGDYDRARWQYEKVLVPAGDKYAQYMLGFLHLHGLGVDADRARAFAWYRLAAERRYEPLVAARDELAAALTDAERARADALFAEIEPRYGDRELLTRAIRRDQRLLRERTGSRTGGYMGPLTIYLPNGMTLDGDEWYRMIERRIEFRLELLGGRVEFGELELIDEPVEERDELPEDGGS